MCGHIQVAHRRNVPLLGDGYTGNGLSVKNAATRWSGWSVLGVLEAIQDDQAFVDYNEVAADQVSARDDG